MYKTTVRQLIRYSIRRLNEGDYSLLKRLAHPDLQLAYPGDNSWATMFRPIERSRNTFYTHRGVDEAEAFARRFVEVGAKLEVEDILVNGPPSNTRVAVRCQLYVPAADGDGDEHNNRAILFMTLRWGRVVMWEDYNDSERTARWDAALAASAEEGASPRDADEPVSATP